MKLVGNVTDYDLPCPNLQRQGGHNSMRTCVCGEYIIHSRREFWSNTSQTSANFFLRDCFGFLLDNAAFPSNKLLSLLQLFLLAILLLLLPPTQSNFLFDRLTASSLHLVTLINSRIFQITTVSPKYWIFVSLNAPLATLEARFLVAMRVIASVPSNMDWFLRKASRASWWGSQIGFVQHWIQAAWRQSDDSFCCVICWFQNSESVGEKDMFSLYRGNISASGIAISTTMRNKE